MGQGPVRGKRRITMMAGTVTAWIVVAAGGPLLGISMSGGADGLIQGLIQICLAIACGILAVVARTVVTSRRSHPIARLIGVLAVVFIAWSAPFLGTGSGNLVSIRGALIGTAAVAVAGAIAVVLASAGDTAIYRRGLIALGITIPLLFIAAAIRTIGANYLYENGRLSIIESSWKEANGGETWAPPGAHSHADSFAIGSDQLSFKPDGLSVGFVETPENASTSAPACSGRDCVQRTSPAGHSMWFQSDSMGRPIGSQTQVVLGHTVIHLSFPVVNENQDAVLTASEMAYRGGIADGLQRTTLDSIMHITWQDVIGP